MIRYTLRGAMLLRYAIVDKVDVEMLRAKVSVVITALLIRYAT